MLNCHQPSGTLMGWTVEWGFGDKGAGSGERGAGNGNRGTGSRGRGDGAGIEGRVRGGKSEKMGREFDFYIENS